MLNDLQPEIGSTISIQKLAFDIILNRLRESGYQTLGPRVKNDTLVYEPIETLKDLPQGYITEQEAGRFRLIHTGHGRYFDLIPGAQSWKQFLFPPRLDLFTLQKTTITGR
jgi:sulfhydrogenase subunit beta (sulfur reductase)